MQLRPQQSHQLLHNAVSVVFVDLGHHRALQAAAQIFTQVAQQFRGRHQHELREGLGAVTPLQHVGQGVGEASLLGFLGVGLAVAVQGPLVLRGLGAEVGDSAGRSAGGLSSSLFMGFRKPFSSSTQSGRSPNSMVALSPASSQEQLNVPALRGLLQQEVLRWLSDHGQPPPFPHVSRSGTIRLNTGAPSLESLGSAK